MRRRLIYLVSVVAALIIIQFIRPEKNLGELGTGLISYRPPGCLIPWQVSF